MEQQTAPDSMDSELDHLFTEDELRDRGASALFVAYYFEARSTASARREIESGPFTMTRLNENPSLGGHFFAALWNGNFEKAWNRADGRNRALLRRIKDRKA